MMIIYSRTVCPYCTNVKSLLESKSIKFIEINIDMNAAGRDYLVEKGLRSVPQIFQGELHIGGFDKLQTWIQLQEQSL
jgi:glutaredoxin 3